jgi:Zn-dependent peptidase ImmA (M78 family)/transcriptional regulator with XRE-family HTH domain
MYAGFHQHRAGDAIMATSVTAPITGSVLTWARQQAAVTVAELAKRAGVPPATVLEWESGQSCPTLAELRAIAKLLELPMAVFFTPAPPPPGGPAPADFRGGGETAGRQLTHEIRLAQERRSTFKQLAPDRVAASAWPGWPRHPTMTPAEVRRRLGLSVAAIAATRRAGQALKLWIAALENQGILIFHMSRIKDDECSGFCLEDATTPVIALNGAEPAGRRVFTLLHEFGHLLDHTSGLCLLHDDADHEKACNRFAQDVLMPAVDVQAAVTGLPGAAAVEAVARRFRVSRLVAAVTLAGRGLISQQVVDDELVRWQRTRAAPAGRDPVAAPERRLRRNLGDIYLGAVLDAMDDESISVADATYFLGAKVGLIGKLERELAGGAR